MKHAFKEGDVVRCTYLYPNLTVGKSYTVQGVTPQWVRVINDSGVVNGYDGCMFSLVGSILSADKPIEPGGGMKFDAGKPDLRDLLDPLLLGCLTGIQGVVAVLKFGAKKYAANSWQKLENAEARYTQAALRHMAAIQEHGLLHKDEESGLLSIYHVCCDTLFLAFFATNKAKAQAEKETH